MSTRRTHVLLPEDLIQEIDELVGPRGRSAFLVDTARNEVRRQRLLQFLQNTEAAWKDEDHPDLESAGAARKCESCSTLPFSSTFFVYATAGGNCFSNSCRQGTL